MYLITSPRTATCSELAGIVHLRLVGRSISITMRASRQHTSLPCRAVRLGCSNKSVTVSEVHVWLDW